MDRLAPHSEAESPCIVIRRDGRQEHRERDLALPLGLGDAFDLGTQPWLRAERQIDRLGERQWLAARGDRVERGLVGVTRKRRRWRWRRSRIRATWGAFDRRW